MGIVGRMNRGLGALAMAAALAFTAGPALAQASRADTIRVAIPLSFLSADPSGVINPRAEMSLVSNIYSALTRVEPDFKVVGDLAESWTNPSPTVWEFKLRPAAKFENGDALDAAMVKKNFDRLWDPAKGFTLANDLKPLVQEIVVVDPTTIRFVLKSPYIDFLKRLSYQYFVDTDWADKNNPKLQANASGPYRMVSFDPETGAVLEANPGYYGKQPAYKRAELKVLKTGAARLNALLADEVDLATIIDPPDMAQLEASGKFKVGAVESMRSIFFWFNTNKKPLDNPEVRKALNYAVDKEAITKALFRGMTTPLKGQLFNNLYDGYNDKLAGFPFDPKKAKDMLTAAGYPDGFSIDMSLPTGAYVAGDQVVQVVAQQLGRIGVKVNVNVMPLQTQTQLGLNPDTAPGLRFVGYATYDTSSRGLMTFFRSAGASNHAKDPEFDKYLDEYIASTSPADAKAAMDKLTARMFEFAPMLYLYSQPTTYAVSKKVNWVVRPDDWFRAYDMTPAS